MHGPINFETTKRVFFEWRFHQYELGRIKGEFDKGCPACDTTPVAVHIDGNKKLYRYNKVGRGIRNSYYSGGIFACDKEVQDHVSTIQNLKTQSSHMCGVSTLKAAKNKPVSFRSLDETGISMASCRHGIILAALNMYQGELYSYAHYLQMNRLQNVSFICQDIICKYWPWALKISSREQKFSLRQGKPFLGVLHAKGHSWYCQVLYGGRWQEGSGLTSGEEAEQVFSYLSRYNNNTKNMLKADRKRKLEAAELNQLTVEHNDSVTPLTRDSNGIGSANDKTTDMEESGIQQLDDDSSTPDMGEEEKPPKFRKICDFPGFKKKTLPARLK
ncbi:uncharacterized protein [Procambarus clarkii]|uniref:uncharacterized protein n=1 Tax=Procambarus clarkii TaxID=6728 RepID=UPI0037427293